jgi:acyl homoserine lactone synthase
MIFWVCGFATVPPDLNQIAKTAWNLFVRHAFVVYEYYPVRGIMVSLPARRRTLDTIEFSGLDGLDGGRNPRQSGVNEAVNPGSGMLTTTLSFQNMHQHGDLFVNLLKARRTSFILRNNWRLPEAEGMEFDQYDTPASRWIAVHEKGEVLAGVRLTPTTAKVGMYTYMIRDAQRGMLESIPSDLMDFEAPVDPKIWEASRIFVSNNVPAKLRKKVQGDLMYELIRTARSLGAMQLLALGPAVWPRWIGRLGLRAKPAGPVMVIDGARVQVALMNLDPRLH